MVYDRLTLSARRRLFRHNAYSYLILTYKARVAELFEIIKEYDLGLGLRRQYLFRLLPQELFAFGDIVPRIFRPFGMLRAILDRDTVEWLAEQPEVIKIFSDEPMWVLQYPTVPPEGVFELPMKPKPKTFTTTEYTRKLVGADTANRKGFFGDGVKVAIIDTGNPAVHESINRAVKDTVMTTSALDANGHGTHVTATIGGIRTRDDMMSSILGRDVWTQGMAPRCDLISIKALGYVIGTGLTSQIIQAIEKAVEYYRVDVINMSLGGSINAERQEDDPYYHVMKEVVEKYHTIPVVAAGNEGPGEGTISSPGWLESVLTVAAYDPIRGEVADFSSRGPTPDNRVKPDTIAPGVNIHTACVNLLDMSGDRMPQRYAPLSGTSMSTPHCSGLVALMRQAHMTLLGKLLTVDEVKKMLMELGHEKTNYDGWGPLTWDMYEMWLATEYGISI